MHTIITCRGVAEGGGFDVFEFTVEADDRRDLDEAIDITVSEVHNLIVIYMIPIIYIFEKNDRPSIGKHI